MFNKALKPIRGMDGAGIFGASFYAALFVFCLLDNAGFSVMGIAVPRVGDMVRKYFLLQVVFIQFKILAAYLVIGFAAGFASGRMLEVFTGSRARPFGNARHAGVLFIMLLAFHASVVLGEMVQQPQLFAESFYLRGGWRKVFESAITANFSPGMFKAIAAAFLAAGVLAILARTRPGRRWKLAAAVAAVIVIRAGWPLVESCGGAGKNTGPNLLIIGLDSLRADRLDTPSTPAISSIARSGVSFENAFDSLPRTFPEWATILTGTYPHTHGIRHMFPSKSERDLEEGSLPGMLGRWGWSTRVLSDFAGDIFPRMKIGFQKTDAPYMNFPVLIEQRSIETHYMLLPYLRGGAGRRFFPAMDEMAQNADPFVLADKVKDAIKEESRKGRFFITVFFSASHFPYAAPYPYYMKFTNPGYSGTAKYHKPNIPHEPADLPEQEVRQIRGLYDGAVLAADTAIGGIIELLEKLKLREKTLVIVLADHGEQLYENPGWGMGHGEHLRGNVVTRIPLVMSWPGKIPAGAKVGAIARDVDIAPTVLNLFGKRALAGMEGVSLVPMISGKVADMGLKAYAETGIWFTDLGSQFFQSERIKYPDIISIGSIDIGANSEVVIAEKWRKPIIAAKHRMVRDSSYKLIYIPTQDGVRYQLYDLAADPAELKDVSAEMPEITEKYKLILHEWMEKDGRSSFINGYFLPR